VLLLVLLLLLLLLLLLPLLLLLLLLMLKGMMGDCGSAAVSPAGKGTKCDDKKEVKDWQLSTKSSRWYRPGTSRRYSKSYLSSTSWSQGGMLVSRTTRVRTTGRKEAKRPAPESRSTRSGRAHLQRGKRSGWRASQLQRGLVGSGISYTLNDLT
jgi:hypothetical protein